MEGEAGGQIKGESIQLQKTIRDLTTQTKLKDTDIQKLRDVRSYSARLTSVGQKARPKAQRGKSKVGQSKSLIKIKINIRQRQEQTKHYAKKIPNLLNNSTSQRFPISNIKLTIEIAS
jgi:hypothetical protein